MSKIRLYNVDDREFNKLYFASCALNLMSDKVKFIVVDGIFDGGSNWEWTSIMSYKENKPSSKWWTFCPRDYEKIVADDSTPEEILQICREVAKGKLYQ